MTSAVAFQIATAEALDFGEQVDGLGGVPAVCFDVVGFEHVEHVDKEDAAGGGRAHRDDFVFFVGSGDGVAVDGLVVAEIGAGDESAGFLLLVSEEVGGFSCVESVAAAACDALECFGEIFLDETVAGFPGPAIAANEDFGCAGVFLEGIAFEVERVGEIA